MKRRVNWFNVSLVALALFVFASTLTSGKWGEHYVFIVAYALVGAYCIWRRFWTGAATAASLVVLRWFLSENVHGYELRVASTAFVVLLAVLCRQGSARGAPA